ncbi:coproporphyrinogen-III oxidase family protein [Enhygromyxa salina]|uniref:Oxygen-independent coproporphyrinogen-III oxidase 1 n=1 Tax=Enhygromyxa salina TaxID=215803 RepID=A0A2S9YTQ1_9BACT|nr:coproporphyrinogen-III oxidase family protein [Enhygromyxa salina]PRQ08466.1 Oxygen-independent coproporphyrinogen-III oxidase 1 [Enhygromyxa salina]
MTIKLPMLNADAKPDAEEPSRRGFLVNYPHFRHWRPEAATAFAEPKPLNVYVHVPYCVQRCAYCFYKVTTLGDNRKAQIDRYVDALCTEIERVSERFHLREQPVETIYFGGGTPTLLSKDNLSRVFDTLHRCLNIAEPEITVEAEPVTLIQTKADHLQSLGVSRISMGIQSFKDEIVSQTGRVDTEAHMLRAIEIAMGTGAAVNIDLMSGLAGETDETWDYSVTRAIESGVHSLTVYKTEIYPNSSYYAGIKRNTLLLPTDDDELRYTKHAIERFEAAGYEAVNFFTFVKHKSYMQRHATNSWRGGEIYGFGVSAFGMMHGTTLQNSSEIGRYIDHIEAGELPLARGYQLSARERMTRDLALGIKLLRFDRVEFRRRYGYDVMDVCGPTISALAEEGYVELLDDTLAMTRKGMLWGDYVGHNIVAAMEG